MKKIYLKSAIAMAVATASTQVLANGLALNEQNASGTGTSYAGRASTPRDASTIYGNPAGLSRLNRAQISAGAAFIHANTDISDVNSPVPGTSKGDMVPDSTVPFAYYAQPLNDKIHVGLGLYVPFGVESDYERSFQGRYHGLHSLVQVITVQPTISYKINDRVSIGGGPTFNRIDGKLTSAVPGGTFGSAALPDSYVDIEGHDEAVGYNLGLLVAITDDLDWGVTYHSKVDYTLKGHTNISGTPAPGLDGHYKARLDITMPESVDTSFTYRLDRWSLYAGATWTRWSRLQSISVENSGLLAPYQPGFGTVSEPLNWQDTWSYALGAAYQLNPQWQLRAGFAVDPSPTSNADRTVRIPVGNRKTASIGAGWTPTPAVTVDVAYAYLRESKAGVNQAGYNAEYQNSADGVSAQVTYRF